VPCRTTVFTPEKNASSYLEMVVGVKVACTFTFTFTATDANF
jgi:hypothetical protein